MAGQSFDAGTVHAELQLNRKPFQRDLKLTKKDLLELTAKPYEITLKLGLKEFHRGIREARTELQRFQKESATVNIKTNLQDFHRGIRDARGELARFNRESATVSLGANLSEFRRNLSEAERLLADFGRRSGSAGIGLDSAAFRIELNRVQAMLDNFARQRPTVTIGVNADTAAANFAIDHAARTRAMTIDADANTINADAKLAFASRPRSSVINADADVVNANTKLAFASRPRPAMITAEADVGLAALKLAEVSRPRSATLNVDADTGAAQTKIAFLMAQLAALNIVSGGSGHAMLILVGVLGLLAPAVALAATALAGLPGLLFAILAPIAAVALGMDGLKRAAEILVPAIDALKARLSATFEAGFTPIFTQLRDILLPGIADGLNSVALGLIHIAQQMTNFITSARGMELIQRTLHNIGLFLAQIAPGITALTSAFLLLAEAGTQALTRFSAIFNAWAINFDAVMSRLRDTGQLEAAFNNLGIIVGIVLDFFTRLMDVGIQMMAGPFGTEMANTFRAIGDAIVAAMPFFQAMSDLFMQLIQIVLPPLVDFLKFITPGIQWMADAIKNMNPHQQQWLGILLLVVPALIAVGIAVAALVALFTPVTLAVMAVVLVLGLLVSAAIWVATNWTTVWTAVKDFFFGIIEGIRWVADTFATWIKEIFSGIGAFISGVWNGLWGGISNAWTTFTTWFGAAWGGFWGGVRDFFGTVGAMIAGWWNGTIATISNAWTAFTTWFGIAWGAFWGGVRDFFGGVGATISGWWTGTIDWISGKWNEFAAWFGIVWGAFWSGVRDFFGTIGSTITGWWNGTIAFISNAWNGFVAWFGSAWGGFWGGVRDFFGGVGAAISGWWTGTIDWLGRKWNEFSAWFGAVWNGFWTGVRDFFGGIGAVIGAWWTGTMDAIGRKWNEFSAWLGIVWAAFWSGIRDFFGGIGRTISDWWAGTCDFIGRKWTEFSTWLGAVWGTFWSGVRDFFGGVGRTIVDWWTGTCDLVGRKWVEFSTWLGAVWNAFWTAVKDFFGFIGTVLSDIWRATCDFLGQKWIEFSTWLGAVWNTFWSAVRDFFFGIGRAIMDFWSATWRAVGDFWNGFSAWLGGVWNAFWTGLRDGIIRTLDAIKGAFEAAVRFVGDVWNTIRGLLAKPVNFMINVVYMGGIKKAWDTVARWLKLPQLPHVDPIPEFAQGGPITGGVPNKDSVPIMTMPGEYVLSKSAVKNMGGVGTVDTLHQQMKSKRTTGQEAAAVKKNQRVAKQHQMKNFAGGGEIIPLAYMAHGGQTWEHLRDIGASMGGRMTSGLRPGDSGYHGKGQAVDLVSGNMVGLAQAIFDRFNNATQIIHSPWRGGMNVLNGRPHRYTDDATFAGHFDHVHWAMTPEALGGASAGSGAGGINMPHPIAVMLHGLKHAISNPVRGGIGAGIDAVLPGSDEPGTWKSGAKGVTFKIFDEVIGWVDRKIDEMFPPIVVPAVGGGGGGPGGERWRAVALDALRWTRNPEAWLNSLVRRIGQESSGNPRAVNMWDSNASLGGTHGLMQLLRSNFNTYRDRGLSGDIYDPLANIVAGINYTKARYGSGPAGWDRPGGYDRGIEKGPLGPGRHLVNNWTGRNEWIARDDQLVSLVQYGKVLGTEDLERDGGIRQAIRDGLAEGSTGEFRDLIVQSSPNASAEDIIRAARFAARHARKGVHTRSGG